MFTNDPVSDLKEIQEMINLQNMYITFLKRSNGKKNPTIIEDDFLSDGWKYLYYWVSLTFHQNLGIDNNYINYIFKLCFDEFIQNSINGNYKKSNRNFCFLFLYNFIILLKSNISNICQTETDSKYINESDLREFKLKMLKRKKLFDKLLNDEKFYNPLSSSNIPMSIDNQEKIKLWLGDDIKSLKISFLNDYKPNHNDSLNDIMDQIDIKLRKLESELDKYKELEKNKRLINLFYSYEYDFLSEYKKYSKDLILILKELTFYKNYDNGHLKELSFSYHDIQRFINSTKQLKADLSDTDLSNLRHKLMDKKRKILNNIKNIIKLILE